MSKKTIIIILTLLLSIMSAEAQNYKWAFGIRGGVCSSGFVVKHNFNSKGAIEGGINYGYWKGEQAISLNANYEWQIPVITKGFVLFFGGGAFLGSRNYKETDSEGVVSGVTEYGIGAQGIAGLEYKVQNIPLVLALDYQPTVTILARPLFYAANVAISAKYSF